MFSVIFRAFLNFSRLFYTFLADKLILQSLGFALISAISGCLLFLGTLGMLQRGQLHFSRMFLVPRLAAPRLAGIFSINIFQQTFYSVQKFPLSNQVAFVAAHITWSNTCCPEILPEVV